MKRILTSCLVVLICLTAFFYGYGKGCYSYAETERRATNEELDAILYSYMQSRGGNIKSISQNGADALLAKQQIDRYKVFNALFGEGSEFTREQFLEHVKVGKDEENGMYFNIDGIGAGFLNTKFSNMALNNTFGDDVDIGNDGMLNKEDGTDNELYDGYLVTDDEGNTCLAFVMNGSYPSQGYAQNYGTDATVFDSKVINKGTPLKYDSNALIGAYNSDSTPNITINNRTATFNIYKQSRYDSDFYGFSAAQSSYSFLYNQFNSVESENTAATNINAEGYTSAFVVNGTTNVYLCTYTRGDYIRKSNGAHIYFFSIIRKNTVDQSDSSNDVNVLFYTNNNLNIINYPDISADGSLYLQPKVNVGLNGEIDYQPYIVNEGDTITNVINNYYQDTNTPDKTVTAPTTDVPSGGGNPSGGNLPNWQNPFPHLSADGEGGFNFNFNLPDLNIDWNISGLKDKFPFSIPFDLIRFVQVLNAEPETPEFDWTIDLKIYQWHIDADLHQFDNLASIVRNVEFIGFCITLVMITRRMIKG